MQINNMLEYFFKNLKTSFKLPEIEICHLMFFNSCMDRFNEYYIKCKYRPIYNIREKGKKRKMYLTSTKRQGQNTFLSEQ